MSYVDIFNTDQVQDLFGNVLPNTLVVADRDSTLQSMRLRTGEILLGVTNNIPRAALLTGTPNQISISPGPGELRLGLPQDIDITASPEFKKITTDELRTRTLELDGKIIDLSKLVTTDSDQLITGQKTFGKSLLPNSADIDLGSLASKFGTVYAQNVDTKALTVDGSEIDFAQYVTLADDQLITGQKTFGKSLLPNSVDVDLGSLASKFGTVYSTGVDAKTLTIDGSEIDFAQYVTLTDDQVITGQKTFGKSLLPNSVDIDLGSLGSKFNTVYAQNVDTKTISIDGSEIDFAQYVTLADDQLITGQKHLESLYCLIQ